MLHCVIAPALFPRCFCTTHTPTPSSLPGKYLNAIRQCGKEIECPFACPIPFGVDERDYAPVVRNSYRFATATLLGHLMDKERLLDRLASLKNYLLLQQVWMGWLGSAAAGWMMMMMWWWW